MLIGLAAVAVVPSGPLWWAPLLPTVGMFAKAIESAACAVLYLHESVCPRPSAAAFFGQAVRLPKSSQCCRPR
jgi:hypothetical protein